MRKKIFSFFCAFLFCTSGLVYADCQAGGLGATSCSVEVTGSVFGIEYQHTISTTCGSGYYACCNAKGKSATCISNVPQFLPG